MEKQSSSYGAEVMQRLRFYYGRHVLRIVRFEHEIEMIQILVEPSLDIATMKKELLAVLDHLLVINLEPKKCLRICFSYGFNKSEASIFLNINDLGMEWLRLRNLNQIDYLTPREYQERRLR